MLFNLFFIGAFVLMIVAGLWANHRAEKKRSIFDDRGGFEITNTRIHEMKEVN